MDEAEFRMWVRKDFYEMHKEHPDWSFDRCVEDYLDAGFDLEGMEAEAYAGYKLAESSDDSSMF